MDNKYKNGKIYKLTCSESLNIYYGSTIIPLNKRFNNHRSINNTCESKNFVNPIIELVEDYPCNNKLELRKREQYYIDNNECVNKFKSYISEEDRKKYNKEYYKNNIEYRETKKKYYLDNKEKIKETKKKYKEDNKDKIAEYMKKHYQKNREIINEKRKEKFKCECGSKYVRGTKLRHERSKKHLDFMNS